MPRYALPLLVAPLFISLSACAGSSVPSGPPPKPRSPGYPQPFHLLPLLTLKNPRLAETAILIAKTGNEPEKAQAARQLAELTEVVATEGWRRAQGVTISRMHPGRLSEQRLERLLSDWQRRHQVKLYEAMRALGNETVLDYCLRVSKADDRSASEQQLALGVLVAHGKAEVSGAPATAGPAWGMPGATPQPPGYNPQFKPDGSPWSAPGASANPAAQTAQVPEPPRVEGGQIINVNEVVDALRPYFLVCYQRALAQYGRFGAWIIVHADVSSSTGMPVTVDGKGDDVPPSMMQCLFDVVKQAQFAPPEGGNARVSIPLTFTQG